MRCIRYIRKSHKHIWRNAFGYRRGQDKDGIYPGKRTSVCGRNPEKPPGRRSLPGNLANAARVKAPTVCHREFDLEEQGFLTEGEACGM